MKSTDHMDREIKEKVQLFVTGDLDEKEHLEVVDLVSSSSANCVGGRQQEPAGSREGVLPQACKSLWNHVRSRKGESSILLGYLFDTPGPWRVNLL